MDSKRSYGIDILRVICMLMVVTNHTLNRGGIVNSTKQGSATYYVLWGLMIIVYVAVDVFAVISGYVSYSEKKKPIRYKRLIEIWFMVVFYGVIIVALFNAVRPDLVSWGDYVKAVTPISSGAYWFLIAYAGTFVLKPLLDGGVRNLSDSAAKKMLIVIIIVFSLYTFVIDRFFLYGGFSFAWIALLYVLGAIIKKTHLDKKVSVKFALLGIILSYVITYVMFFASMELKGPFGEMLEKIGILSYNDFYAMVTNSFPTMCICAIFYVILFSKISVNEIAAKVIAFVTPAVFAVYILNCHHLIWEYVINNCMMEYVSSSLLVVLWKVISFSVIFTVSAIMVDILRIRLFKLCRINVLVEKIDNGLNHLLSKIVGADKTDVQKSE